MMMIIKMMIMIIMIIIINMMVIKVCVVCVFCEHFLCSRLEITISFYMLKCCLFSFIYTRTIRWNRADNNAHVAVTASAAVTFDEYHHQKPSSTSSSSSYRANESAMCCDVMRFNSIRKMYLSSWIHVSNYSLSLVLMQPPVKI